MQISEHHVRERAYYIWEDEGRIHGRADAHWILAEAELGAAAAPAKAKTTRAPVKKAAEKVVTQTKAAAVKPAAKVAAKPATPKAAKASKAAVTAGLAAKSKPARAPVAMH